MITYIKHRLMRKILMSRETDDKQSKLERNEAIISVCEFNIVMQLSRICLKSVNKDCRRCNPLCGSSECGSFKSCCWCCTDLFNECKKDKGG